MWFELEVRKTIPFETMPDYCTDLPPTPPKHHHHLFAFDAAITGSLRLLVPRKAAVDTLSHNPFYYFITGGIKRRLSSMFTLPSRQTLIYRAIHKEKRN